MKLLDKYCSECGTRLHRTIHTFCSRNCQYTFEHKEYIKNWKAGKITGLNANGVVTPPIKRYLRDKFNDCCSICGWNKVNSFTKKIPLVADHIDGNWKNNTDENLRLICPNCDSLSSTYGGANRGKGRGYLKVVKFTPDSVMENTLRS